MVVAPGRDSDGIDRVLARGPEELSGSGVEHLTDRVPNFVETYKVCRFIKLGRFSGWCIPLRFSTLQVVTRTEFEEAAAELFGTRRH